MALTVDPTAERQPECFGMGDDSESGSDASGSLRVTPTGGFDTNVCFAMGGDSDSDNGSVASSGSSDSEYTSANSSEGDPFMDVMGHQMDGSSEDEASGDDDLEAIYSFSIDQLADAIQAGVSAHEIENHVRGVIMGSQRKTDCKTTDSEKPKAEEEIIQEMVQLEEKVQSTVKKAIRKSLGRMSASGNTDPRKSIQKARQSAIKRHRQSLGLSDKADEDQEAKIAQAREEARARRRKSLAKILTQSFQAAADGKDIDAAIREAAEMARARHRKSIAKSFAEQKPPADLDEAFDVNNDTLAKITKARNEAAENRRKSLVLKQQQQQQQQGSPEKPKASPEKEDVQDQVRRAMALAAERRRQSFAEKQKQQSPDKAVPAATTELVPQANDTVGGYPQSDAGAYSQQVNTGAYVQQACATPYVQANSNDGTGQALQQMQPQACQWQQANSGWQPQQQVQQQVQQQQQQPDSYQWQQPGTYEQQAAYQQPQQQDAYHWQQQQNSCQWQQEGYQQQDASHNYAYDNYQQQGPGWQQQGGDYQQGMPQYGWQVQQEWQQNNDGTFYNTQTPSWQSSMTNEELRIQRTVADMYRSDMYSGYGHYAPGHCGA